LPGKYLEFELLFTTIQTTNEYEVHHFLEVMWNLLVGAGVYIKVAILTLTKPDVPVYFAILRNGVAPVFLATAGFVADL